ncbi:MAG: hypothetical protein MRZ79_25440 [Bacteroidia bacterium]|nr:hypothetical protein [Bacteroidia bacterium]
MGLFKRDQQKTNQSKKDCKAMCKANFGFDKELKKACLASCKGSNPPQSREEFLLLIGESGDFFLQDERLAEEVLNHEPQKANPIFLIVAIALVGAIFLFTFKLIK